MKKLFPALIMLCMTISSFSQVSINTDNSQPNPSAMLDVKSSNRGFLPPRMTFAELNAIVTPAAGLIIYCTDCGANNTGAMAMFINGAWYMINATCMNPGSPAAGTQTPAASQIIWNWNAVPSATGYKWSATNNFATATDMGTSTMKTETNLACGTLFTRYVWACNTCGNSAPTILTATTTSNPAVSVSIAASANPACAGIQITFTATPVNGGALPGYQWKKNGNSVSGATNVTYSYVPVQGDAITCQVTSGNPCTPNNPAISNTITMTVNSLPVAPAPGNQTAGQTQVIWNWTAVAGATGYKWNTTNDYATATNVGNVTTKTETGLLCNSEYNRYVWAYNGCGVSPVLTLVTSTTACGEGPCPGTPTVTYNGTTYNTIKIGTQCWLKENLNVGARIDGVQEQSNNSVVEKYCMNNLESNCTIYGGLYQWAEMVGYTNGGTNQASWNPVPSGYVQGICPSGWHLPSEDEWTLLTNALGGESVAGGKMKEAGTTHWSQPNTAANNSTGFTALAGGWYNNGFGHFPQYGHFWAATENGDQCRYRTLNYNDGQVSSGWWYKTTAHAVRCIKDTCSTYVPVSVGITPSVNPACSGASVTFTATPVNGGTNPYYQWKVNGMATGSNSATHAYIPVNNDVVTCTVYSGLNCVYGNPAISNPVTMAITNLPVAPTEGTHVAGQVQVIWNWNTVPGATGYLWNTVNDHTTATNMGAQGTTKTETGLACGTGFTRFVWAYSSCGVSAVTTLTMSTLACSAGMPCPGVASVTYAGKTYNTVKIGAQCWLKENLNLGTRINGVVNQSDNGITEKYCYDDQESNCDIYGGLYQWSEMMKYTSVNRQGLCPDGWLVPNQGELSQLVSFLGTDPGGKLKETGFTHWSSPNTGATNESGFTSLPGGLIYPNKTFSELTQDNYIWSSSASGDAAFHLTIRYYHSGVDSYVNHTFYGFSVRCLKDTCSAPVTAGVTIGTQGTSVCAGAQVTFTATAVNGGSAPTYQWKVNGVNAGTNSPSFVYAPANNDVVTCVMSSNHSCVTGSPATSNALTMIVNAPLPVDILIGTPTNTISAGMTVTFTAYPQNGGSSPAFQWKVNNINQGANSDHFTFTPVHNDAVTCVLTSNLSCVSNNPATSGQITMLVAPAGGPCPGTTTVLHGGKTYNTVQVGTQCWLKENLNIGMKIPGSFSQTDNTLAEKYCYNDLETNCDIYGGLYQWAELVQYLNGAGNSTSWSPVPTGYIQGLCPTGWHIPGDAEWSYMVNFLGGGSVAGGKMKETGILHWETPNTGATNGSGFTALGSGHRDPEGTFVALKQWTNFWSSTESTPTSAWSRAIGSGSGDIWTDEFYIKTAGYSVRCVKN